ncbi:MAG: hypothetical protein RDV48_19640 [Candidatus Eremiobacteraeota bacterium]|nr:hypothetical protein [Candidatus Eremiobacteraeota bacterium]
MGILFEAFRKLAEEVEGSVTRGGIFTSAHPKLKGTLRAKPLSIFFQKESGADFLCIRISGRFPFLLVIKPRYKTYGIFNLDLAFKTEEIESPFPLFVMKTDDRVKCREYLGKKAFSRDFQELISPAVLEKKFFQEFFREDRIKEFEDREFYRSLGANISNIDLELNKLSLPSKRLFFFPYMILDRRGAFLKVRFTHYLDAFRDRKKTHHEVDRSLQDEVREVISCYLRCLEAMLDEGGAI